MITKQEESVGYLYSIEKKGGPGSGNWEGPGSPRFAGWSGSNAGRNDDLYKYFNEEQLNDLETKISDILPEPIEFTYLNKKDDIFDGGIQWDSSDKNKAGKGTITFKCTKESKRITDLEILNLTGGLRGVDQSIFVD